MLVVVHAFARQAAPDFDRRLTFSCAAIPVATAVKQLSEQTGVLLTAQGPISSEMLVLRFNGVPLRVAMAKIADATSGEWIKSETGYQLGRSPGLARTIERAARAKRIANIKKALADRLHSYGKFDASILRRYFEGMRKATDVANPPGARGGVETSDLSAAKDMPDIQEPGERLTTRVLAAMSPEELADIPSEERTVFSSGPTQMQRPLGSGAYQSVQDYANEQAIWNKVASEQGNAGNGIDVTTTGTASTAGGTGGEQVVDYVRTSRSEWTSDQGQITKPIAKVLLIVTPDWESGTIDIQFKICDAAGNVMATPRTTIATSEGGDDSPADQAAGDKGDQKPKPKIPHIELSPLAKELAATQSQPGSDQLEWSPYQLQGKIPSAELIQFLLHPETNDPLSLVPSELLLKFAETRNVNVAVCLDDSAFGLALWAARQPDQFLDFMGDSARLDKDWIIGRPSDPIHPRLESRKALGKFLRDCAQLGRVGLEPLGAYAQNIPEFESSLGWTMSHVLYASNDWMRGSQDWLYVRLFGSLSSTQREALTKGGRIPLTTMTASQIDTVARIIYGRDVDSDGSSEGDSSPDVPPVDSLVRYRMMMMNGGGTLKSEPTELLPKGVDYGITLTMSQQNDTVVFTSMKMNGASMPPEALDPDSVAMMILGSQNYSFLGGDQGFQFNIDGYQMGKRQTYSMTLNLPLKCADAGSVSDAAMDPGKIGGLDRLPPDIQKQIQDRVAEMKKMYQDMPIQNFNRRRGDNGVPPPQR